MHLKVWQACLNIGIDKDNCFFKYRASCIKTNRRKELYIAEAWQVCRTRRQLTQNDSGKTRLKVKNENLLQHDTVHEKLLIVKFGKLVDLLTFCFV